MKNSKLPTKGFTRLDLLASVAMISGLFLAVFPASGKSRSSYLSARCLSEKRTLIQAITSYANDHDGWLPPNSNDSIGVNSANSWVGWADSISMPSPTNALDYLTSPRYSALAYYLGGNADSFKCPADLGSFKKGVTPISATRSVSINCAVGSKVLPAPRTTVDGIWLDGNYSHRANKTFRCYGKISDAVDPRPADLWIILDESPDSINDGTFAYTGPGVLTTVIDWPATYHDFGAGFAFMDGHAEIHSWLDRNIVPPKIVFPPPTKTNNPDYAWIAQHGTARVPKTP